MLSEKKREVLGNLTRGKLFVVSGPAGTGKNTLVNQLLTEQDSVRESVSCTTRPARKGEFDGEHYHFMSEKEFVQKEQAGEFLESVELYNNRYGTLKQTVEEQRNDGKHVVLVIDTQGALKMMDQGVDAAYIFVRPPSMDELRRRLIARRTETDESIERRLKWAEEELRAGERYEYQITNDDLYTAYQVLKSIFIAEEHRKAD